MPAIHFPAETVHQIGNLMKGKKADAYRQSDTQQGQFPSAHRIPVPNKKIHILKEKKQRQISCNPCCQYPFCRPFH